MCTGFVRVWDVGDKIIVIKQLLHKGETIKSHVIWYAWPILITISNI